LIPNSQPTIAENGDNQLLLTTITKIQPTYTAEHSSFVVKNTTNRYLSEEKFISPVELFCNTHRPTEQSDPNTVTTIPTPPNYPKNQLQSNGTETDFNNSITDKCFIFLPNITEDNQQDSPTPETDDHNTNITKNTKPTDNNREFTNKQLPTIIYLSTDIQLSNSQHLPTDNKITDQTPILSHINRPLLYHSSPANRNPRNPNVFPPDITYISNYTEADKSPD
jgi:hypothetical protein